MNIRKQILAMDDLTLDKVVKIQGTQFDRKRKLNDKQVKKCKKLYEKGNFTFEELGVMFNVDYRTIRAYMEPEYRAHLNRMSGLWNNNFRTYTYDSVAANEAFEDRVAYKRTLVRKRKIKLASLEG